MQVEYRPSQPIPMRKEGDNGATMQPVYSLSEKLFDPGSSPPMTDFMKRLYERHSTLIGMKIPQTHPKHS